MALMLTQAGRDVDAQTDDLERGIRPSGADLARINARALRYRASMQIQLHDLSDSRVFGVVAHLVFSVLDSFSQLHQPPRFFILADRS